MILFIVFNICKLIDLIILSFKILIFIIIKRKTSDFNYSKFKKLFLCFNKINNIENNYYKYPKNYLLMDNYFINYRIFENFFIKYFYFLITKDNKFKKCFIKKNLKEVNENNINNFFNNNKIILSYHFYSIYDLFIILYLFNKNKIMHITLNNDYKLRLTKILEINNKINKFEIISLEELNFIHKIIWYINNEYDILVFVDPSFINLLKSNKERNTHKINLFGESYLFKTNIFDIYKRFCKNKNKELYLFYYLKEKEKFEIINFTFIKNYEEFVFNNLKLILHNNKNFYNWEFSDIFIQNYFFSKKYLISLKDKLSIINKKIYKINKNNFYLFKEKNNFYLFYKNKRFIIKINKKIFLLLKYRKKLNIEKFNLENDKVFLFFSKLIRLNILY